MKKKLIVCLILLLPGCDPVYQVDIVVESEAGLPISGVKYNILAPEKSGKYSIGVGHGKTSSNGMIEHRSVGVPNILLQLEKDGYKSCASEIEMELINKKKTERIILTQLNGEEGR